MGNDDCVGNFRNAPWVAPRSLQSISYNRLNGIHVSESPNLLQDILRKEWGFDGMIMSDWFGTYGVDAGINAGLDLEMPGTGKWRTLDLTKRTIGARKVAVRTIKERALQVLKLVQKCAQAAPEVSPIRFRPQSWTYM